MRKDFKFALRARKVYIREGGDINVRDKKLPIYINDLYWQQRICLDDSYLVGGIPFNGQKQQEIRAVEYPWIDYSTELCTISESIREVT